MDSTRHILVFGGAFDPVTKGHIAVAKAVAHFQLRPDRRSRWYNPILSYPATIDYEYVMLMPCFQSVWGKDMAPAKHRMKMVELAIQAAKAEDPHFHGRLKASEFEVRNEATGGTFEILNALQEYMGDEFCFTFVIGQDHAEALPKWKHFEQLVREYEFLVVGRPGYAAHDGTEWEWPVEWQPLGASKPIKRVSPFIPSPLTTPCSSTQVRKEIAQFGDTELVYPEVKEYIRANSLYNCDLGVSDDR